MGAREGRERANLDKNEKLEQINDSNVTQKKSSSQNRSKKQRSKDVREPIRNRSANAPKVPKALLEKKALFLQSIKTEQKKNAKLTLKVNQKCIGDIRKNKNVHVVSGLKLVSDLYICTLEME